MINSMRIFEVQAEMSIYDQYVFDNGVGAQAVSASCLFERHSSTLLTSALTYCAYPKEDA